MAIDWVRVTNSVSYKPTGLKESITLTMYDSNQDSLEILKAPTETQSHNPITLGRLFDPGNSIEPIYEKRENFKNRANLLLLITR